MEDSSGRSIAIVGAGIGGLTMALSLARRGISSTVYERAATLREVGAGLQLSSNALRVLDRLDLTTALRQHSVEATAVTLRSGRSGRRLASVPVGSGHDAPYLSIHRGDLQKVLLEAVETEPLIRLETGHELVALKNRSDGIDAEFRSIDGERSQANADILIAADGVNSRVASHFRLQPAQFAGAIAWRGRVTGQPARDFNARTSGITAWLGAKRHAVVYPIRSGEEVNLVLVEKASSENDAKGRRLPQAFSHWNPDLKGLIANAADFTPWPLRAAPPSRPWVLADGRVVLIGDAAHAMLPFAAQGAAMAIEDAYVLSHEIATHRDLIAALASYEGLRRARVERVVGRARFHRFVYHLPPPLSLGRDVVMAVTPPARLRASLSWLYDWEPPNFP
ncbi:FAD-dependent monooxygenase [Fulvimarina sp. MAC8]|uniref:FAD-dependent monooxygenase n=1 Tax=Fulvimarina sp. MAC8 TaxID=3162874 RepID=UPI0032F060B1